MEPPSSEPSSGVYKAHYRPPPKRPWRENIAYRTGRIRRNIVNNLWRALKTVIAVTVGVGIAIAIIAAGEGIDKKINELLNTYGSKDLNAVGIDLHTIRSVLNDTRDLLRRLSIGATVAIVGMVMWASMPQRRREISIARQEGQHRTAVMIELGVESFILCVTGGLFGILLGLSLCYFISLRIPLLPMSPTYTGVFAIFPVTVMAILVVATCIAFLLATTFDPDR
jgi:ABC-type antimicrobial peptide transport system permease subunit